MINVSDRLNHAADCRILPCPRPKVQGLTLSQVKASRRIEYIGVLKAHMVGGTQGLGMISTVRSASSPNQVIPCKNCGRQLIAKRGRRSPKKGPRNPVFQGRVPTAHVYAEREFHRHLRELSSMYKAIARARAGIALEERYEHLRESVINHYGRRGFSAIENMERAVRQTTVRQNIGRR